jgi:hypothetical protein
MHAGNHKNRPHTPAAPRGRPVARRSGGPGRRGRPHSRTTRALPANRGPWESATAKGGTPRPPAPEMGRGRGGHTCGVGRLPAPPGRGPRGPGPRRSAPRPAPPRARRCGPRRPRAPRAIGCRGRAARPTPTACTGRPPPPGSGHRWRTGGRGARRPGAARVRTWGAARRCPG